MLESPSYSDYDDMNNGVSKPTLLEPTIKLLIKETSLGHRSVRNLVTRGQNIRAEISLMVNSPLKSMIVDSK